MAGFNEIQVGRYNRMIQKLLSMKGPASMNELSTTLQLVHNVFNGVENRYLESWERFSFQIGIAGGAGVFGAARLRNPAGSNVVAVFEKINIFSNITANPDFPEVQIQDTGATDLTLSAGIRWDIRSRIAPTLIASFGTGASIAFISPGRIMKASVANDSNYDFILTENMEFPLFPGQAIQVIGATANTQVNAGYVWRERFLEESERA